jgi:hypothetical protein
VWTTYFARSLGKAQRDEARDRLLADGLGEDAKATVRCHRAATGTEAGAPPDGGDVSPASC